MWDFLVFIYINWISMCLPHSASRKLQRWFLSLSLYFSLSLSLSLSCYLLPFTLCQANFRPYEAQLAKRKRWPKGNMHVVCNFPFALPALCLISRVNRGLNKLINIVVILLRMGNRIKFLNIFDNP